MARQKKYTAATLGKACERYFAAITRRVKVTEMVDSGKRDDKGHVILIPVPVKNTLGEEVEVTEYIIPPSMHAARPGSPARVVVLRFLFCYSRFALDERSFLILPTSGRM